MLIKYFITDIFCALSQRNVDLGFEYYSIYEVAKYKYFCNKVVLLNKTLYKESQHSKYEGTQPREKKKKKVVLEISGFEPEASRMQSERSTTELYPRSRVE